MAIVSYATSDLTAEIAANAGTDESRFAGSPLWWVKRLDAKLRARNLGIGEFENYYEGIHKLAFATEQFKNAFGKTFKAFADNFMAIVVDSVDERLNVTGFRIPLDDEDPSKMLTGDSQAWDIWQANQLDAGSHMVHTDALVDSVSYVIVGPGLEYPEITGESATEVITESAPGRRGERVAALKKWFDEDGFAYATLFLPGAVYKYVSDKKTDPLTTDVRWNRRSVKGEQWPVRNPLGIVPVVPFCNQPRLVIEGRSEIEQLVPLQNAINKLFMDMLIASEFSGFMQRWATGVDIPVDPETNQPIDTLKMSIDRFLTVDDENAKFGTLAATELSNYTNAIAMAIQHFATRSATPPHYFLANQGNFPSGESLKAAETGLVAKVHRRERVFGEAWEEVIRLGLLTLGETAKAKAARSGEVIWADAESRTESEHIDALTKLAALGVPEEMIWERAGLTPQEIARAKEIKAAQAEAAVVPPVSLVTGDTPVTVNLPETPPPPPPPNRRIVRDAKGAITGLVND